MAVLVQAAVSDLVSSQTRWGGVDRDKNRSPLNYCSPITQLGSFITFFVLNLISDLLSTSLIPGATHANNPAGSHDNPHLHPALPDPQAPRDLCALLRLRHRRSRDLLRRLALHVPAGLHARLGDTEDEWDDAGVAVER